MVDNNNELKKLVESGLNKNLIIYDKISESCMTDRLIILIYIVSNKNNWNVNNIYYRKSHKVNFSSLYDCDNYLGKSINIDLIDDVVWDKIEMYYLSLNQNPQTPAIKRSIEDILPYDDKNLVVVELSDGTGLLASY